MPVREQRAGLQIQRSGVGWFIWTKRRSMRDGLAGRTLSLAPNRNGPRTDNGSPYSIGAAKKMNQEELCVTPATELTRMIREKIASPVEIMHATLQRAQVLNPRLNAICTPTYEAALQAAREAEALVMR